MQILCWLFNGEQGKQRSTDKASLWVRLSADDHGRCLPWRAKSSHSVEPLHHGNSKPPHTGRTEFYISRTHLFGLAAAVVNFNRLPEFMAAVCRRIGKAPSWHVFDDQGTLDFETCIPGEDEVGSGMIASDFVGFVYHKKGRPFLPSTHVSPASIQAHLVLQNMLQHLFRLLNVSGAETRKMQDIYDSLREMRDIRSQQTTLGEMIVLGGKLIFLLMSCFDKMSRGGLQSFFHWLSELSALHFVKTSIRYMFIQ